MSDSSSDDEHINNLKQAVDSNFINDFMFTEKSNKREKSPIKHELPPSLRYIIDEEDRYNELHVTPGFQKHVAKHLSKLLEKQLKEVEPKTLNVSNKRRRKDRGVRLLRNSSSYILCEDEEVKVKIKRKKKVETSDSEEEREKVAMVAVTPDWVLNKEGTKGWEEKTKGEVIQGVLLEHTKKKKKVVI